MGTGSPLRISPRLRRTGSYERRGKPNRVLDRTEQRRHLDELDQAAFGDNRSMNDQPDAARPSVVNAVTGQVSGFAVLAGTVNDGVHVHLPPRHAVEWPHRFGHVPPLAASFRHRAASSVVLTSDGPVSGGVLSGLGGVGKTQLAVDYAENAWAAGDLDLLMWITAASRERSCRATPDWPQSSPVWNSIPRTGRGDYWPGWPPRRNDGSSCWTT